MTIWLAIVHHLFQGLAEALGQHTEESRLHSCIPARPFFTEEESRLQKQTSDKAYSE